MTRPTGFAFLLVAGALLLATPAAAQFGTPSRQFHDKTSFRLEGRHLAVACESCHLNGVYKGTPTRCMDCHWTRRQDDRFRLQLGSQCEQCHTPASWTSARFDHGAATGVQLSGAHRALACQACHKNDNFRAANSSCLSCHQKDYQSATNPNHVAGGFPTTCDTCHRASDTSFHQARFDHQASFPLVGTHAQQVCAACHKNNVYKGTSRDCVGCHRVDYNRTTSPSHVAAGFPTTCDSCHRATDSGFKGATFNHSSVFALVGVHAQQACATCHVNNVYRGTARDCVGCHRVQYDRTTSPAHAAAGFPTTCDSCHRATDASFGGANFNHASVFALVGTHAQIACTKCHVNNVFRGTARDCVGCHRVDYEHTTSPPHAATGFSTSCDSCHRATDASFRGVSFNHSTFALVGAHAQQACTQCHVNNVYKGTARDCVGCHRAQYDRTTSPAHAAAGFSTACETCHRATDASFGGANFNHASIFALVGTHAQIACTQCHVNSVFRGTPRDCVGCHRVQYDRTTSPAHAAAGFSTTCDSCHRATDASFKGATFNHATVFALVGTHAQIACTQCHVNNVYKGTARDCVGCHRVNYDRTTSPNHAAAGFPTTCDTCHRATDASFKGATFNHSTFALVGVHAQQACAACHINNVYKGTARDCVGCHRTNYDRTTSPNHTAAGFPTSCESCHRATDSTWAQGTFTHSRFPITSGNHKASCTTCHTNPASYQSFTCLTCHEHSQAKMDSEHRGRNGYRYDSLACYSCHPNGRAG